MFQIQMDWMEKKELHGWYSLGELLPYTVKILFIESY